MKILIISPIVGKTAPGIVFEKLIHGLAQYGEIDLCTSEFYSNVETLKINKLIISPKTYIHQRIQNLSISLFSENIFDRLWAYKVKKEAREKHFSDYDIVLSFISFNHYSSLITGYKFSKVYNSKWVIYSVDAIPAPLGWMKINGLYKGLIRMMNKFIIRCDLFFSSNKSMLTYQLSMLNNRKEVPSDVIHTPGGSPSILPFVNDGHYNFIYAGGIYGLRKSSYLISGFVKLLEVHPNSRLIFLGTSLSSLNLNSYKKEVIDKIEVLPYMSDLSEFYKKATALIDIDAEVENDVFLSSKMTNYIMINRVIISQTGSNSPSRHIFNGIDSIIQCGHNSNDILNAMLKAIAIKDEIDFQDRDEVIKRFDIDTIVKKMYYNFDKILTQIG